MNGHLYIIIILSSLRARGLFALLSRRARPRHVASTNSCKITTTQPMGIKIKIRVNDTLLPQHTKFCSSKPSGWCCRVGARRRKKLARPGPTFSVTFDWNRLTVNLKTAHIPHRTPEQCPKTVDSTPSPQYGYHVWRAAVAVAARLTGQRRKNDSAMPAT